MFHFKPSTDCGICFRNIVLLKGYCKMLWYLFLAFFTKSKRLCLINVLVPRYQSDSCMKAKSCLPKGDHNDVNEGNLPYLIDFNFRRNVCNFIYLDGVSNFCKHLFLRKESNLTFLDHTQILTNLVILCLMYFFTYCPGYWHFCLSWMQVGSTQSVYFGNFANHTKFTNYLEN